MKKSLYQIEQEYLDLASQLEQDELTPEIETALAINEAELQGKAVAYAYVIKQSEHDVQAIKDEIARLQALAKSEEKKADRLKAAISQAMQFYGIQKVETAMIKLSFRASERCVSDGVAFTLADRFTTLVPETRKPNLTAIKAAIKEGEDVQGYRIETVQNLQIK
jgi:hypothetical protein